MGLLSQNRAALFLLLVGSSVGIHSLTQHQVGVLVDFWLLVCLVLRQDLRTNGWLRVHYAAKDAFEFLILLLPSPNCWEHRHVPLCLALLDQFVFKK